MVKIDTGYLTGQVLVAMPAMRDPRFERSVIYVCAHNAEGAMGLVLNRLVGSLTFDELLRQVGVTPAAQSIDLQIHFGGPVETSRGFVLHSGDYHDEGTLTVTQEVGLTASLNILKDIASGAGPRHHMLALGYAGWGPGQLDHEFQENGWLSVQADDSLLFDDQLTDKWERAIKKLGIDFSHLSGEAGHA